MMYAALVLAPAQLSAQGFVDSTPLRDEGAIALRPQGKVSQPSEQWATTPDGTKIVTNVTLPTLTPYLPAPGKETGAAVIVAPGGGFVALGMEHEGIEVAQWLAARGIAAFVLKYRLEPTPRDNAKKMVAAVEVGRRLIPMGEEPALGSADGIADAEAAVAFVRSHAKQFSVLADRVGLLGFSAGAIIAVNVAVAPPPAPRPDFVGIIYGSLNRREVPNDAPPMFAAIALDDPLFGRGKSLGLVQAWREAKRPVEAHLYEKGGHGFGMRAHTAASALWIEEFRAWLQDRGVLAAPPTK